MAVAEGMKCGGTDPVLKYVCAIKALGQEGDHQTKGMACAVNMFGSRCLVTSSDVDCKKPFIMDRYSRFHSYRLDSSIIKCQTFESFSFLLLNEDERITRREQCKFIFELPLEVPLKKQGTFDVLGFGRKSFTLDPKKTKLDKIKKSKKVILGSPIVQNEAVVGVVGLNDKGERCPFFIDHQILDQLKESLEEDVKRCNAQGRYAQETGRAPLETLQQESRLKDTVSCNADIMDELALRLDKPYVVHNSEVPLKKHWENLAEYFKLPSEIKLRCQQSPQNSPAKNLFGFLVISRSFTVGRVIDCLNKIGSKHLSNMVEKLHLPGNTELQYLYDNHLTVLQNIWLHLNVDGRGNWRDFGNEIKEISKDKLVRFANPKKCTETVLDIIQARRPKTTVLEIKTVSQELEREDVCRELVSIPANASISELLDNVDAVEKIGTLLDDEIPGKKGWREFARKFSMTRVECDSIRPDGLPSPTKELFKHLAADTPELTIKDFLAAAVSIKRDGEVVEILKTFYNASSVDKVLLAVQTEMDQRS